MRLLCISYHSRRLKIILSYHSYTSEVRKGLPIHANKSSRVETRHELSPLCDDRIADAHPTRINITIHGLARDTTATRGKSHGDSWGSRCPESERTELPTGTACMK
jgi:hypothetical protein